MTAPAQHTVTGKGKELLVRIAEAQIAGSPLSDSIIDRRHATSIGELIAYRPRLRANGRRAVNDDVIVTDTGRYFLAAMGRSDLSRALLESEEKPS